MKGTINSDSQQIGYKQNGEFTGFMIYSNIKLAIDYQGFFKDGNYNGLGILQLNNHGKKMTG